MYDNFVTALKINFDKLWKHNVCPFFPFFLLFFSLMITSRTRSRFFSQSVPGSNLLSCGQIWIWGSNSSLHVWNIVCVYFLLLSSTSEILWGYYFERRLQIQCCFYYKMSTLTFLVLASLMSCQTLLTKHRQKCCCLRLVIRWKVRLVQAYTHWVWPDCPFPFPGERV